MNTLIIIPTYNEIQNIKNIIVEIQQTLQNYNFSILVVDDSSPDGTIDEVKNLQKEYSNINFIVRKEKLGLASAYIEGMKYGKEHHFDAFVEFDADFSHDPKYLPTMLEKLENYDLVIGSRYVKDGRVLDRNFIMHYISKFGSLYSQIMLNCPIKDITGGFNGWRSELIDKIGLNNIISKGYSFQIEMKYRAYKNNAKVFEFPITFKNRMYGVSKMTKSIIIEAFLNVLKLRFCHKNF